MAADGFAARMVPAGTGRSRRRRAVLTLLLALVLSSGLVLASAASLPFSLLKPVQSVCLGSTIGVGVRGRTPTFRKYRIKVLAPSGQLVWSKAGRTKRRWQRWNVAPSVAGRHTVSYKVGRRTKKFGTNVLDCSPVVVPAPTPTPTPPEGPIELSDSDGGLAALFLEGAKPGGFAESCLLVTYGGSSAATVRMYGETGGSGLDPYLRLTVTRGTLPSLTVGTCSGFVADPTDYRGAGAGIIYRGSLADFPDSFDAGLVDPSGAGPESWTDGERHAYRFRITVLDDNAGQGRAASQTFVWEARTG